MKYLIIKNLIIIKWVLILKCYSFELNVTKKENYTTFGKNVTVEKLVSNENAYGHKFQEALLLTDVLENGDSIVFDKLFFREQPVKYATVFWNNEEASVVHLYTDLSTVVLLNNGNGRFSQESVLSDKFVTNSNELNHPSDEREVTLDLKREENYTSDNVTVNVTRVHKFDKKLHGYKVYYQNADNFKVVGLKYDVNSINVPLDSNVYGVYLYSMENVPLLVELVSTTSNHKYYVKGPGEEWAHVLLPSVFDPRYNKQLLNRLEIAIRNSGFRPKFPLHPPPEEPSAETPEETSKELPKDTQEETNPNDAIEEPDPDEDTFYKREPVNKDILSKLPPLHRKFAKDTPAYHYGALRRSNESIGKFDLPVYKRYSSLFGIAVRTRSKKTVRRTLRVRSTYLNDDHYYNGIEMIGYHLTTYEFFELSNIEAFNYLFRINFPPGPFYYIIVYYSYCPLIIQFMGRDRNYYYEFKYLNTRALVRCNENLDDEKLLSKKAIQVLNREWYNLYC